MNGVKFGRLLDGWAARIGVRIFFHCRHRQLHLRFFRWRLTINRLKTVISARKIKPKYGEKLARDGERVE